LKKSVYDAPGHAAGGWLGAGCLRLPAASACRARSSRCGRFEAQLFFLSLVTRSAVIWATTRAERGESTWHPATGGRAPVTCTKPSIYAIRLTGPGVRRATSSKPSAARPLANIVHRLNEPAFTLENRILSFFSRVDAFSTITGWHYIKNEDFEQS